MLREASGGGSWMVRWFLKEVSRTSYRYQASSRPGPRIYIAHVGDCGTVWESVAQSQCLGACAVDRHHDFPSCAVPSLVVCKVMLVERFYKLNKETFQVNARTELHQIFLLQPAVQTVQYVLASTSRTVRGKSSRVGVNL